jgi:hypothetical protein
VPLPPRGSRRAPTNSGFLVSAPVRRTFIAVVAVAAVGAGGYAVANGTGLASTQDGDGATSSGAAGATPTPVSTEPPPAEDVATDEPAPSATGGESGGADVVLTFAGWEQGADAVEVSGFVANASDDSGTCTATLTRGAKVVTASAAAVANAGTMACGGLLVPGDDLSSGAWDAVLGYKSSSVSGKSSAVTVDVP